MKIEGACRDVCILVMVLLIRCINLTLNLLYFAYLFVNFTGGGPQPPYNTLHELVLDTIPSEVTDGLVLDGSCETAPPSQVKMHYNQ